MEVEVIVMVMVVVMVIVTVTVSPVPVVVAVTVAVAADVLSSSVLLQPCKDREAIKPKQMAASARTSCMITRGSDAGIDAVQASSLLSPNRSTRGYIIRVV